MKRPKVKDKPTHKETPKLESLRELWLAITFL